MILHGYFYSDASWRVRIALGLKGLTVEHVSHHLRRGEQRAPDYLAINPQGLVPTLVADEGRALIQSLAIMEWLDETHPEPSLLPGGAMTRAHPGLRARARGRHPSVAEPRRAGRASRAWRGRGRRKGLGGQGQCRRVRRVRGFAGRRARPLLLGAAPTLADVCLAPRLGNARRFGVDVCRFPRLLGREAACQALPAFAAAVPEQQADAE